jgi:membrane-associated phospholipid phosphatase
MKRVFSALAIVLLSAQISQADVLKHSKNSIVSGFDTNGLLIVAGALGAVGLAQPFDYEMRNRFSNYQVISRDVSRVGDFMGTGALGVAIVITQFWVDDNNQALSHAEALGLNFISTSFLKVAFKRGRPNSENQLAMPSGHTSTMFATATHMAYFYGWKVGVPAFALASFVASTRWSDDAHWFSDTVAGAFLGFFWGRATAIQHEEEFVNYALVPEVYDSGRGIGLSFAYSF